MKYIKELKLSMAARKLLTSNATVKEVAYFVGFDDPNYFIREFKDAFGLTPNQYRKASQAGYPTK